MILSVLGKLQKYNPIALVCKPLLNTCVGTALLLHRLLLYYFRSAVLVGVLVFCGLKGWSATKTWDGGASTFNWNDANNWNPNGVPVAGDDVIINLSVSIAINANPVALKSITVNGNATVTLAASGGNRTFTLTNGTPALSVEVGSTLILDGGALTRSLTIAFASGGTTETALIAGTLQLNTTGNNGRITCTNGVVTITGSLINNEGTITSTSANLQISAGGIYQHAQNGGSIPAATWNLNSNCNITGVTSTVPTATSFNQSFGNFTWNCAAQSSAITLPSITAKGNFTISNTNTQTLSGGANTFNIGGNWINNVTTINTETSNVTFNGSTRQTIGGSSSTTFYNLILDNTNGAVLGNSETVNGTLTLTNGKLNLDVYNLSLGSAAVAGTLNASNMIVAEGAGQLRRTFTANGSYIFPVGDVTGNDEYSPVTVNVTGSAFSSAYIGVSLVDAKHPDNNSTTNYLTRYWNITQSGITGCVATITGTYINSTVDVSGTLGSIKAAQLNGTFNQASNPWVKAGGSVLSGTTLTYTGATITAGQTSAFTGITSADPTVSITGGNVTVCQNAPLTLTANPVGDSPFTYNWTGLITGTPTSTATATTSSVGGPNSYTVTVTDGNGFSSSTSSAVTVTVVAPPTISLNTSNESCPGSNDGSINTTLSGGLSNIRYIKLTQKYVNAEAYQQVQEIQAFEVFTGTNVALSSNGATASSSSTYQNDVPGYGPQLVNDGTPTGYFFWHSFSTNVGEWVKVDLGSAKNIDYLKIWNREDCCWSRGQNMLLELFDSDNNLVYSKSVNLWGGVDGANSITENVVDLSWNDSGGTTLNRTGLDAGTYTLNYADAAGCSASEAATLTVTPNNTAGAASSTPTLCINTILTNITHATTGATGISNSGVSGANGLPAGVSATYASNTISISGTPTASGTFSYSIPLTGGCGSVNATGTIIVRPVFTAGAISTTGETICNGGNPAEIGSSTAAGGGDNSITYEWRANGTPVASTNSATYDPPTGLTATTTYTRWAKDGSCNTTFTQSTGSWVVTVNPLPTATVSNTNSPICTGDDAVFTLTGTSGATVTYKINSGSNATVTLTGGTAMVTVTAATVNQTLNLVSVADTNCSQSLSGSSTVVVNPLPDTSNITTN